MSFKINGVYIEEREPDAVVGGCIEIFENVWPSPNELILAIENECANSDSGVYWTRAETIGAGAYQNIRTNRLLPITHLADISQSGLLQNVNNMFYTLLLSTSNSYAKRHAINENFFHENYNLLKYSEGEEYKAHYDGGTGIGRSISAICYLNNDYEGGEIEFVNFKVKIKPEPGMMILFPSNYAYRHIAHPVTKGTKYALVTWIRDRIVGN
jgi:hypothetical protein